MSAIGRYFKRWAGWFIGFYSVWLACLFAGPHGWSVFLWCFLGGILGHWGIKWCLHIRSKGGSNDA